MQALQTIVSRSVDPVESAVVSVTKFHIGEVTNVIAESGEVSGTARTLVPEVRDLVEQRIRAIAAGIAAAHGAEIAVDYDRNYPVTRNHADAAAFAARVAGNVVGDANVDADAPPVMGGEDFSYMLEERPGAFVFIGNGESAGLHNPAYDFNDEAIPIGCSYWARLVEAAMPDLSVLTSPGKASYWRGGFGLSDTDWNEPGAVLADEASDSCQYGVARRPQAAVPRNRGRLSSASSSWSTSSASASPRRPGSTPGSSRTSSTRSSSTAMPARSTC